MNMEDPLDRPDLARRRQGNSYGDPAAISIAASRRPVLYLPVYRFNLPS
jgi:hypothetical protein